MLISTEQLIGLNDFASIADKRRFMRERATYSFIQFKKREQIFPLIRSLYNDTSTYFLPSSSEVNTNQFCYFLGLRPFPEAKFPYFYGGILGDGPTCAFCGALKFIDETYLSCCKNGKIKLPLRKQGDVPTELEDLIPGWTRNKTNSRKISFFKKHVTSISNAIQLASRKIIPPKNHKTTRMYSIMF